ncbi:MAG TPA: hypothetical protein VKS79_08615 [Gemmataceae bacterium]|nr:hypothetical protein [Gemmataceae bacterium]
MRASIIASLIILALLGLGLRGWVDEASPPKAVAQETTNRAEKTGRVVAPVEKGTFIWKASVAGGFHTKIEDAKKDALLAASRKFADYLEDKHPEIAWTPSPEFVDKYLVKGSHEETRTPETVADSPLLYQIRLDVELNADNQKEVEKAAREYHIQTRLFTLFRWVGSLILLLGGIAGFIRVDDWKKGYLTLPLRAIVIVLVAAGIFLLWWLV